MKLLHAFFIGLYATTCVVKAQNVTDNESTRPLSQINGISEELAFFEKKIRPVLTEHCYQCHSEESGKKRGGLALDTAEGLLYGGENGPAIIPGNAEGSLMIAAMRYEHKDIAMPPKKSGGKLSEAIVQDFEKWVSLGAPDPRNATTSIAPPLAKIPSSQDWWAWKPPVKARIPIVKDEKWARNDVDRFILAALEQQELKPVGDAERLTLLRRITFDLTGLPPTPEEISGFLHDTSSDAYEKVVDRLLISPRFGERWGRLWLDVARYAESTGKDINLAFPHAWRYRDYVISSFNQDKPYNRFIEEQIAGDLLPASNAKQRAEHLIATGFLALGAKSVNEANPRQFALDLADEQIDTVTQAFLGLTVSCARCHDHKFDPISQKEYTALAGIFLSTDTHYGTFFAAQNRNSSGLLELPSSANLPIATKPISTDVLLQKQNELQKLVQQIEDMAAATFNPRPVSSRGGRQPRNQQQFLLYRMNQIGLLEAELENYDQNGAPKALAMGVLDQPVQQERRRDEPNRGGFSGAGRRRETPRYQSSTPDQAIASRYLEREGRFARSPEFRVISDSALYTRGEVGKPGEKVPRGFLSVLTHQTPPAIPADTSGRRELAEWMLMDSNPLTARVMVNRVWQWMFGQGFVSTPDNFGTTGQTPSHPQLLDYLAVKFREGGWSVKSLIKKIALSHTYQLASTYDERSFAIDPDNRLLWRMNKKRLDAESLRDGILSISGQLDLTPPVGSLIAARGNGPIGIFRQFPNVGIEEEVLVEAGAQQLVRSVYLPIARGILPDALAIFDFAETGFVTGKRDVTNVPEQALYLLNSTMLETAAQKFAGRVLTSYPANRDGSAAQGLAQRIQYAFGLALGRVPSVMERKAAHEFFSQFPQQESEQTNIRHGSETLAAWTSFCRALFACAEFRYLN